MFLQANTLNILCSFFLSCYNPGEIITNEVTLPDKCQAYFAPIPFPVDQDIFPREKSKFSLCGIQFELLLINV